MLCFQGGHIGVGISWLGYKNCLLLFVFLSPSRSAFFFSPAHFFCRISDFSHVGNLFSHSSHCGLSNSWKSCFSWCFINFDVCSLSLLVQAHHISCHAVQVRFHFADKMRQNKQRISMSLWLVVARYIARYWRKVQLMQVGVDESADDSECWELRNVF